jgi:hypothetical protein
VTRVALRLPALTVPGHNVERSGVRWLRDDGHACRAGEVVAYCNVGVRSGPGLRQRVRPFGEEERDFQAAIATRVPGTLRHAAGSSEGGFHDQYEYQHAWAPEAAIAHVECAAQDLPPGVDADGVTTRLLMLAGRRATEIAEVRTGLLAGWHNRHRAWWGDTEAPMGTLTCLGVCDQVGMIRGASGAYVELFEAVPGPAHVAYFPDDALVHCARVALEQWTRTPEAAQEIAADFAQTFAATRPAPSPRDWITAGAVMASLLRSPLTETFDVLTSAGLRQIADPPDAVLLSLLAEGVFVLRHRRLGYALHLHLYRILEAGPAFQAWLRANFEQVRRTPEDIRRDYCALIDAVRARRDTQFLVLNVVSMAGGESIHCYAGFERPIGKTLGSVRLRELNLMLHDLARERNVAIVDVDAIAGELGILRHVPDAMHGSGLMQAEVRAELIRLLRERGVPGFAGAAVR